MMRSGLCRFVGTLGLGLSVAALAGCSTWKGLGEDFQKWGESMQRQGGDSNGTQQEIVSEPADTVEGFPDTVTFPAAEPSVPPTPQPSEPSAQEADAPMTGFALPEEPAPVPPAPTPVPTPTPEPQEEAPASEAAPEHTPSAQDAPAPSEAVTDEPAA